MERKAVAPVRRRESAAGDLMRAVRDSNHAGSVLNCLDGVLNYSDCFPNFPAASWIVPPVS
jgi:hypothetical protein